MCWNYYPFIYGLKSVRKKSTGHFLCSSTKYKLPFGRCQTIGLMPTAYMLSNLLPLSEIRRCVAAYTRFVSILPTNPWFDLFSPIFSFRVELARACAHTQTHTDVRDAAIFADVYYYLFSWRCMHIIWCMSIHVCVCVVCVCHVCQCNVVQKIFWLCVMSDRVCEHCVKVQWP